VRIDSVLYSIGFNSVKGKRWWCEHCFWASDIRNQRMSQLFFQLRSS